jgi:hypothetical protein
VFRAALVRSNEITSLAAAGPGEAWAVGQLSAPVHGLYGYAVHWDGRSWRRVAVPSGFWPRGVLASAPANVWIDGLQYKAGSPAAAVVALRWAGTGWQRMPAPPVRGGVVAAVGASGAWALSAGAWTPNHGWQHVSAYWDGAAWTRRPFPVLGPYPAFAASPGGGAWAFGTTSKALKPGVGRLVVFRWIGNGTGWREVPMPHPEIGEGFVAAAVGSSTSIWLETVSPRPGRNGTFHSVLWHWNGKTLSRLPSPMMPSLPIAADGHGGAWFGPLAHWTGRQWKYPARPGHCRDSGLNLSVAAIPRTRSAWGALDCQTAARPVEGAIEVNGPRP